MNKKQAIHNFWRSNIFIILMFAIMSLLSAIIMWHYNYVGMGADSYFHAQRIYELHMSFKRGVFLPSVALNGFNQNGSAIMTMYPQMILFPIVSLSYLVKSVVPFVYTTFILRNLFAFIVSYYSCYRFNNSKKISFLFSTAYTLNSMVLCYAIVGYDVGRAATLIFLPMILFGFYELLYDNGWLELSIGMSMILISHVINAIIAIMFISLLVVFNLKKINFEKIKAFVKAVITSALTTSLFWVPFLILYIHNKIWIPPFWSNLTGIDFIHSLNSTMNNIIDPSSITIIALIGFVLSCVFYKKMCNPSKQMFWISVLILLLTSQFFPWNILNSTFIKNDLQFPWRFLIIPQLLLSYLFAEIFINLFSNRSKNRLIPFIICIISIVSIQLTEQKSVVDSTINNPTLSAGFTGNASFKLYKNEDLNNLLYCNFGMFDYYPSDAESLESNINNHISTYDHNKQLSVSLGGNGKFSFTSPQKINKLSLPFLYYNGIDYQVKLDGKTVKGYPNKNSLMTINNVHKGKHRVQIIVHKTKAEIASYILSLIGLLILLGTILKNFLKKRKNK